MFFCALWSPAGKWLTSWLSFVVSNCEFDTFPLVSWVRCGTWLYRFLIFAPLLTLKMLMCMDARWRKMALTLMKFKGIDINLIWGYSYYYWYFCVVKMSKLIRYHICVDTSSYMAGFHIGPLYKSMSNLSKAWWYAMVCHRLCNTSSL